VIVPHDPAALQVVREHDDRDLVEPVLHHEQDAADQQDPVAVHHVRAAEVDLVRHAGARVCGEELAGVALDEHQRAMAGEGDGVEVGGRGPSCLLEVARQAMRRTGPLRSGTASTSGARELVK
jgi:hypothetical protein